jgi:hypothetical protein
MGKMNGTVQFAEAGWLSRQGRAGERGRSGSVIGQQKLAGGVDNGYFSAGRAPLENSGGRGFDSRRERKFM